MLKKTHVIRAPFALAFWFMFGCGQSQQQTDTAKTDSTEVASTPSESKNLETPPASSTTQPTQQPASKPPATKSTSAGSNPSNQPAKPATKELEAPKLVTVPSGATLVVALETHLRTDSNATGDAFRARTTEALRVNEVMVIPAGSEVRGHLTLVKEPHRTSGKAQMTLVFDEFVDPRGESHAISTEPIVLEAEGDKINDEKKVAAGAVIGGVIGALTSKKKTKGAVTGAVAGAAAGGAIALATKGKQLDLPPGQQFSVELTAPVSVPVSQLTAGK